MGDLVRSEAATSPVELHQAFNAAVSEANVRFADRLASPLTITLGDEFQGLTRTLAHGAAVMQWVRWSLLLQNVRCRFVVGEIDLATPLNVEKAWNMMGPGLAKAREKLERKKDPNAYRFSLPSAGALEVLTEGVGSALTDIESEWTERQASVVIGTLKDGAGVNELARRFGITEGVVYKHRRAAKLDLYGGLWSTLQRALSMVDSEKGHA